jgi:hypothetical protein
MNMGNKLAFGLMVASLLSTVGVCRALTFHADDKGINIDNGNMGTLTLGYPLLSGAAAVVHKPVNKVPAGSGATVTYDGGATLTISVTPAGEITYAFDQVPADVKTWKVQTIISFSYQQAGKWKMDNGPANSFPAELGEKPQFFQNHATEFELINFGGKYLSFHMPENSYVEMTDNRKWHWSVYAWQFTVPMQPGSSTFKLTVVAGQDDTMKVGPIVDAIGQPKAGDWPEKVKSVDELMADVKTEAAYYASFTPPQWDKYGGLPGSKDKLGLNATGFFHVEKKQDKWILADPDGNAFFHLGICAFMPGDDYTWVAGRESIYDWLPPLESEFKTAYRPENGSDVFSFYLANTIRKYGKPYNLEDFQARMIDRVRKFGFNSIGAFAPSTAASHAANFPFVSSLPLGAFGPEGIKQIPGIRETWDPFDDTNRAQVEKNFAAELPAHADDPLLIGYFLTNEPIYEDIPKVVPTLKGTFACKRALVKMLSDKYKTIDAFNQAWGLSAKSFDELNDTPLVPTQKVAFDDVHDFTGLFFETFFKLVADTFHKYDTHHMLIGNRFQPGTINNEQLCTIAGKYLDIMSFNYYTNAIDPDFLNRIYKWTGRPMIMSEFFWPCPKESGLVGASGTLTQKDRGLAYRNYVEKAASMGYIVGIEWFTLVDQATTGRWFQKYNGEQANSGLFSVADRPYKDALAEMLKTNYGIYDVWLNGKAPYVFDNPQFSQVGDAKRAATIPRATGPITVDGAATNWPGIPPEIISGKRIVQGADPGDFEGSFRLCWDDANLYLLATIHDDTPMKNANEVQRLWSGDGIEVFLGTEKTDEGGPLLFTDRHLVIGAPGAGKAPYVYGNAPQQYPCDAVVVPGADGKSYVVEAAIPWEALGIQPKIGQELLFDLGLDNSDDGTTRTLQLMWNGSQRNSVDRSHWGHARLTQ